MWVFSSYGFFSTVIDYRHPSQVVIRARHRRHLENLRRKFIHLMRGRSIEVDDLADYTYRISVPRAVWGEITSKIANEITYTNFKMHAEMKAKKHLGKPYIKALHEVWHVMADAAPKRGKK